jgi:hypothetical protein
VDSKRSAVPLYLALAQPQKAADLLVSLGDLKGAYAVAQSDFDGAYPPVPTAYGRGGGVPVD